MSSFKVPKHFWHGCKDTMIIIAMTVSPTLIGVLAALVKSKFENLLPQFRSGEFLLYSVSFLCASFLVFSEKNRGKNDLRNTLNSIIFICLSPISAFYGIMMSVDNPNIEVIKSVSLIAFFISIPIFLYSQVLVNEPSPDISAQRNEEARTIEEALS